MMAGGKVGLVHDLIFPLFFIHTIVNVVPGRLKMWVPIDCFYIVLKSFFLDCAHSKVLKSIIFLM